MADEMRPRLHVDRPVWTVGECYQIGYPEEDNIKQVPTENAFSRLTTRGRRLIKKQKRNAGDKCLRVIQSVLPCIGWMRTYKLREYLIYDIISGITSAIFHVPQGMANALANNVMPVYGLYGSFFPSLVYSFMGTSMQCSVGTFTVVSLLAANAVRRLSTVESGATVSSPSSGYMNDTELVFTDLNNSTSDHATVHPGAEVITPIEVTVAVTFLSGIVQVLLGILRLGRLGVLISPSLAGGFMTGCAVQIIASQLKGCFGLTFKDFTGVFSVINTFIAVFKNLPQAHLVTSMMSLCVCVCLIVGKDLLNPRFLKAFRIPLPVDLIMVILCSIVSYYMELNENYGVPIVAYIPRGLPAPVVPKASLIGQVIGDAIAVGLVGFAATFSMGTTFARKYNHKVDANQEFLALGSANIFSGFFLCLPGCGSLARSSVLESVGCKTQLTGMISCIFLVFVLYFIGPLLQPLPKCVLATILATALKGYLFNIVEVKRLWNISKADAVVWVVTCLSVIVLDVSYGLVIGVIITLLSVTWRMEGHRGILLREVKASGLYLPQSKKKSKVCLSPDHGRIVLFRFANPLCFATAANFEADINRIIRQIRNKTESLPAPQIVVDCSSICFMDNTGLEALQEAVGKCAAANVTLSLAALSDSVFRTLQKSELYKGEVLSPRNVYPSIQDAVLAACSNFNSIKDHENEDADSEKKKAFDDEEEVTLTVRENGHVTQASIICNGCDIVRSSYL